MFAGPDHCWKSPGIHKVQREFVSRCLARYMSDRFTTVLYQLESSKPVVTENCMLKYGMVQLTRGSAS